MKKKVTIHTSLFELQLYWRSKTVCSQLMFILVLCLMIWLGISDGIKKFSTMILILDLVAVMLYGLIGLKISVEEITEEDVKTVRENKKEKDDKKAVAKGNAVEEAEVDHKKADKVKIVTESSSVINNKVGATINVPKQVPPTPYPEPQPDILSPEQAAGKNLENVDIESIMDFFGDDDTGIEV